LEELKGIRICDLATALPDVPMAIKCLGVCFAEIWNTGEVDYFNCSHDDFIKLVITALDSIDYSLCEAQLGQLEMFFLDIWAEFLRFYSRSRIWFVYFKHAAKPRTNALSPCVRVLRPSPTIYFKVRKFRVSFNFVFQFLKSDTCRVCLIPHLFSTFLQL